MASVTITAGGASHRVDFDGTLADLQAKIALVDGMSSGVGASFALGDDSGETRAGLSGVTVRIEGLLDNGNTLSGRANLASIWGKNIDEVRAALAPRRGGGGGGRASDIEVRLGGTDESPTLVITYQGDNRGGFSAEEARSFIGRVDALEEAARPGNGFVIPVAIEGQEALTIGAIRSIATPGWDDASGTTRHVTVNFGEGRTADNREIPYRYDGGEGLGHGEVESFLSNLDDELESVADPTERREIRERVRNQMVTIEGEEHRVRDLYARRREGPTEAEEAELLDSGARDSIVRDIRARTAHIRDNIRRQRAQVRMLLDLLFASGRLSWRVFIEVVNLMGVSTSLATEEAASFAIEQMDGMQGRLDEVTELMRGLNRDDSDYVAQLEALRMEARDLEQSIGSLSTFIRDGRATSDEFENLTKSLADITFDQDSRQTIFNA